MQQCSSEFRLTGYVAIWPNERWTVSGDHYYRPDQEIGEAGISIVGITWIHHWKLFALTCSRETVQNTHTTIYNIYNTICSESPWISYDAYEMFLPRTSRPTDVPDTGLICDLLWADPDKERIVMLWKWSRVRILPVYSSQCVAFRGQRWLELVRSFSQNFVFVMHMPQDIAGWAENDRGVLLFLDRMLSRPSCRYLPSDSETVLLAHTSKCQAWEHARALLVHPEISSAKTCQDCNQSDVKRASQEAWDGLGLPSPSGSLAFNKNPASFWRSKTSTNYRNAMVCKPFVSRGRGGWLWILCKTPAHHPLQCSAAWQEKSNRIKNCPKFLDSALPRIGWFISAEAEYAE